MHIYHDRCHCLQAGTIYINDHTVDVQLFIPLSQVYQ